MKSYQPQTADDMWSDRKRKIGEHLAAIANAIDSRPPPQGDWSKAGDLGYVEEKLAEIVSFLGGPR